MKKLLTITAVTFAVLFTACEKQKIEIDESQLSNNEVMNRLQIIDEGIWNTMASQSIQVEESVENDGRKALVAMQEWPKGGEYYFALYEDLYPSEGDYDFNDVMLKSKLYLSKKGNKHEGYFETTLLNKGGSLPVEIGLMFYEVSGKSYTRIPFENILVNGNRLNDEPWTKPLSEMGEEWSINFEFENNSNNIWISYFIKVQGNEIMTGGFAPSNVESFTIPHPQYLTSANLPWGLEIEAETLAIPNEKELFLNCFPEFKEWAESGGVKNKRWFESPDPSYTNN